MQDHQQHQTLDEGEASEKALSATSSLLGGGGTHETETNDDGGMTSAPTKKGILQTLSTSLEDKLTMTESTNTTISVPAPQSPERSPRDQTPPPCRGKSASSVFKIGIKTPQSCGGGDLNSPALSVSPDAFPLGLGMKATAPGKRQTMMELTPVTRNTGAMYIDGSSGDHEGYVMVSPEDCASNNDLLALPSSKDLMTQQPLKQRPIPMSHRSMNRAASMSSVVKAAGPEVVDSEQSLPAAVPIDRKSLTFTSRDVYEQGSSRLPIVSEKPDSAQVVPYQPSRRGSEVGLVPQEELSSIFMPREPAKVGPEHPVERQWSIPSLRMANQLQGDSSMTASYTDEEDDLQERDVPDDVSWSTRGSSLCLPEDDDNDDRIGLSSPAERQKPLNIVRSSAAPAFVIDDLPPPEELQPRKHRDLKAMDWLQTIQQTDADIAEAASSKFLTGATNKSVQLKRQHSTPPTMMMASMSSTVS